MRPNLIPTRLDNDGLSNAIVEIHFNTDYNASFIQNIIKDGSESLGVKEPLMLIPLPEKQKNDNNFFLGNSEYRIQVTDKMISFNFVRKYTLWPNYFGFMLEVLNLIDAKVSFLGSSVRYISQFNRISIFEQLDGNFGFSFLPTFAGSEFKFKCHVSDKSYDADAIIAITDTIIVDRENSFSVVDIVVGGELKERSLDYLKKYLDFLHKHEKNLFFLMMKEEFVKSLGAHYE